MFKRCGYGEEALSFKFHFWNPFSRSLESLIKAGLDSRLTGDLRSNLVTLKRLPST